MAMKSYFMDDFYSIRAEINNCKNKTKDPTCVDMKVSEGYRFVENSNIDEGFLNRSKVHLNRKGTALLSRYIANFVKYI